jgi:PhzF family phenazine biosynthesis protein
MAAGAPIYGVDAFASGRFRGNPAAVCLLAEDRDPEWMQALAAEMNLSETAFVRIPGGTASSGDAPSASEAALGLRWFTPKVEVALCGHATLASAHVLWESGRLSPSEPARFDTKSGLLSAIRRDDGWIEMDFPATGTEPAEPPDGLIEALGAQPARVSRTANRKFLVELFDAETVRGLEPDFGLLGRVEARGIIVSARGDDGRHDIVSRYFAPAVGVPEDPVTGSAHCILAPYWARRLGKERLLAYQASQRGGVVEVTVRGERIGLAGQAVTVWEGRLEQDET